MRLREQALTEKRQISYNIAYMPNLKKSDTNEKNKIIAVKGHNGGQCGWLIVKVRERRTKCVREIDKG